MDREERPDVDAIYMEAVQALTRHGGWPMTVFLLPDGTPFYGGTYFPKESRYGLASFRQVLSAVAEAYRDQRESVLQGAEQLQPGDPAVAPAGAPRCVDGGGAGAGRDGGRGRTSTSTTGASAGRPSSPSR